MLWCITVTNPITERRRPRRQLRRSWCRRGSPPGARFRAVFQLPVVGSCFAISLRNKCFFQLFLVATCKQQTYEHIGTIGMYQHWRFNTGLWSTSSNWDTTSTQQPLVFLVAPVSTPTRRGTSTTTAAKMQKDWTKGKGDVAPMAKEPQVVSVVTSLDGIHPSTVPRGAMDRLPLGKYCLLMVNHGWFGE